MPVLPSPSPFPPLPSRGLLTCFYPGPKVVHQVPADSVVATTSAPGAASPLFHFPSVSSYVIPRQEFCSRTLTVVVNSYRILGHPVCLRSPNYPRNEFLFNFCLVLDASTDFSPHLTVTLKLANLLCTLEEQSHFLSRDTSPPNTGKIYALCEILLEDLNNYCESMIPIDDANTLNIKLFPTYAPPPPLLPHHVPLSTVRLSELVDPNWDLTMLLILPHINGINSVRQIALLADADYKLVRKAISHLLYYNCIFLLDVFSFSAIYAPTAEIADFVDNEDMQAECARYVTIPNHSSSENSSSGSNSSSQNPVSIRGPQLAELYFALKQGQSVKSFYMEHAPALAGIDIRRFITFGVIKGFIYRVHKYALALNSRAAHRSGKGSKARSQQHRQEWKRNTGLRLEGRDALLSLPAAKPSLWMKEASSSASGGATNPANDDDEEATGLGVRVERRAPAEPEEDLKECLEKYLDGTHCFDEICTELMVSEKEVVAALKEMGDVQIIHR